MNSKLKKLTLSRETVRNLDDPGVDKAPESILSALTTTRCCSECTTACSICCP